MGHWIWRLATPIVLQKFFDACTAMYLTTLPARCKHGLYANECRLKAATPL